jgi:hypothetical protein
LVIYRADSDHTHFLELLGELAAEGVSRKDAKMQRWEEDERAAVLIMAGNSCPPYGSSLAEAVEAVRGERWEGSGTESARVRI